MRLLLVGAPGSGKGTQAELLSEKLGLTHLSSGDLLRSNIENDTEIGRAAQEYVRRGDLVPDEIVMTMLLEPVMEAARHGGYILDGFPRTVEQAKKAYEAAKELSIEVQVAIHLDVPEEELVRRLLARGRGQDDTEDVIRHRLEVYQAQTLPMLDYYADREELIVVDGTQPIEEVQAAVLRELDRLRGHR